MQRCLFITIIILVFLIPACNNSPELADAKEKTVIEKKDSMATTEKANDDPDPTDTIATEAYNIDTYNPTTVATVKRLLLTKYADDIKKQLIDSFSRKFILIEYDFNSDGSKEILVGLNGSYFCGSGGCTLLLLKSNGEIVTSFSVSEIPVIVATSKTNGWNDLYIYSNKKFRVVKFDGNKYPSNPSMLPVLNTMPSDVLPRLLNVANEPYPKFTF